MTRLTTLNLPDFYKATIGFDRMFDEMQNAFTPNTSGGYPPYNIVKVNETSYAISLAVAGFNKDDIKVEQDGNTLLSQLKILQKKMRRNIYIRVLQLEALKENLV